MRRRVPLAHRLARPRVAHERPRARVAPRNRSTSDGHIAIGRDEVATAGRALRRRRTGRARAAAARPPARVRRARARAPRARSLCLPARCAPRPRGKALRARCVVLARLACLLARGVAHFGLSARAALRQTSTVSVRRSASRAAMLSASSQLARARIAKRFCAVLEFGDLALALPLAIELEAAQAILRPRASARSPLERRRAPRRHRTAPQLPRRRVRLRERRSAAWRSCVLEPRALGGGAARDRSASARRSASPCGASPRRAAAARARCADAPRRPRSRRAADCTARAAAPTRRASSARCASAAARAACAASRARSCLANLGFGGGCRLRAARRRAARVRRAPRATRPSRARRARSRP